MLTLDWSPLDLLSDVFFLLRFEGELDKDLLQFLIDIVDAQLLKAIVLNVRVFYRPNVLERFRNRYRLSEIQAICKSCSLDVQNTNDIF